MPPEILLVAITSIILTFEWGKETLAGLSRSQIVWTRSDYESGLGIFFENSLRYIREMSRARREGSDPVAITSPDLEFFSKNSLRYIKEMSRARARSSLVANAGLDLEFFRKIRCVIYKK